MRDFRRVFLAAVLALSLGAILPVPGASQDVTSHARIVRVSYVQGTVTFNGANAIMNMPVTEASQLSTGDNGLAEVQFEDASSIRLASETSITFAQLARLSTGEAMTRVDLDGGEAEFLIPASSAGSFAVNVRGKNILFNKPGRFRILSTDSSPLEIAVWKGEVVVRDLESGKEVSVRDRETFTLNPADLGEYDLQGSVLADDLDKWSEQRDQDLRSNYVAPSNTYTAYDQYYSGGGYSGPYTGPGFYGYNGFGGCPYYGFYQPYWFASPCSGFFGGPFFGSPFFGSPFFFSPPVVIIVPPRRPIPIRPPTVPTVARSGEGTVVAKPGFRSFRDQSEGRRVFNDENFQRGTEGANAVDMNRGKAGDATVIAPGQRTGGNAAVAPPPQHTNPAPQPVHAPRSSAPASRPPSPPHSSTSGSHGSSGGFSHASAPASHSSGGRSK